MFCRMYTRQYAHIAFDMHVIVRSLTIAIDFEARRTIITRGE